MLQQTQDLLELWKPCLCLLATEAMFGSASTLTRSPGDIEEPARPVRPMKNSLCLLEAEAMFGSAAILTQSPEDIEKPAKNLVERWKHCLCLLATAAMFGSAAILTQL